MGFMADIPSWFCYVRAQYLYNLESHFGEFEKCWVVAVDSVFGHAPGFDILLENGAMFSRLPVSAFCWKTDSKEIPLEQACLWNNFSYSVEAHEIKVLRNHRVDIRLPNKTVCSGNYLFTLTWYGHELAEQPGDGGFKRLHLCSIDTGEYAGNYVLQPSNRLRWYDASWVTRPFPERPEYLTNDYVWDCENVRARASEDSGRYFYEIEDLPLTTSD